MKVNPVGWFEINVQDMERARQFYESVLQLSLSPLAVEGCEYRCFPWSETEKGISGALVQMPDCPSGGNSVRIYFSCEDCAMEAARVVPAGGQLHTAKTAIGEHGFYALALDTEGNLIGLHSMR